MRRLQVQILSLAPFLPVAQFGSAPALGAGCRGFKSLQVDHFGVSSNGRTAVFGAVGGSSILSTPAIIIISSEFVVRTYIMHP